MLCILYVNAVSLCLGLAAISLERVLPAGWPRRWLWCAIIPLAVIIPGVYRAQHMWSITGPLVHQAAQLQSYDTSLNPFWLTLSAGLFLWGLANALRVSRVIIMSRRERGDASGPAVVDGIPVVVTDSIGPATVGFWRSRVLLPRWVLALPGAQRRYVVRHEEEHRMAHDAQLLFVASLPLILMPWNLGMWWLLRRLCLAVEVDCDNRVVVRLGDATAYGELLLKVAQASSRGPRLQPAFLGGAGTLERRLTALLAPTPLRHLQRYLLPAAAVALLFVVVLTPHPVLESGSHAHGAHAAQVARQ